MTPKQQTEATALLILKAILEMSDEAEKLGGATCIAGIASLHKMQQSIQRNKPRIYSACKAYLEEHTLASNTQGAESP